MAKAFFINVIAFGVMATIGFNANAQVKTKSLNKKQWTLVESQHFRIFTDVKPKKAKLTSQQLERYRAFCVLFLGVKAKATESKLDLFVSDKDTTWKSMGMRSDLVSMYRKSTSPSASSGVLFANMKGFFGNSFRKPNAGRSVLLNSIAQDLFYSIGLDGSYPYWFRTGFAHYLATYSEPKDQIFLGGLDGYAFRLQSLFNASGSIAKFDTKALFSRDKGPKKVSKKSEEAWLKRVNRLYMASFLTVHYLYSNVERRKQLTDYLDRVLKKEDRDLAFVEAFGMTHSEFDKKLLTYAKGKDFSALAYDREQIDQLLVLPSDYEVNRLDQGLFLQNFARGIDFLGPNSFSEKHRAALLKDLKSLYPEIFDVSARQAL